MLNRRELMAGTAGAAAAGLAGPWGGRIVLAAGAPRVALARDPRVFDAGDRLAGAGVERLCERAVAGALGARDAAAGFRRLFAPSDVVGIKINCLAGRGLSTHVELVEAVIALLVRAGVPADSIVVWDRSDADLRRARYTVRRSGGGPLCFGTNDDYERDPIEAGSVAGCLSRILTRRLTAVINLPILKDHDLAGISGALKNFYGAIHNPNKYHSDNCNPFVADLYAHPAIRGKVRLTIFDALRPQYHGGPAYVPAHTWKLGAVFASLDPVAADATALGIIAGRRRDAGMESLDKTGRAPLWLRRAAELGLGVDDGKRVDEVRP